MHVRWGARTATGFLVTNGVKQGDISSPMLFNVYMDDLSIKLNQSSWYWCGYWWSLNHFCYADDLCLISLSSAGMQKLLDMCSTYATEHSLTYNGSKSHSLCFKPKHIKLYAPCFYLNKLEIPKVDQCKYLSIMISIKNFDIDMKRQMRNINILSRKYSKYSPDGKCTLINHGQIRHICIVLQITVLYCACTVTAMRRMRIAYNNSLRRLLGKPKHNSASGMFVQFNIKSFGELLRSYIYSFVNRLQCSNNLIVSSICESTVTNYSNIWTWWYDMVIL